MSEHTIAEHARVLRQHLTQYPPTEGFHLVDVRAEIGTESTTGDEVAVVFRWRRNPHTFVVRFGRDLQGPYSDLEAWPEGQDPLEAWCEDVQFWLMEELDTGLLARATRHREGEAIVLSSPSTTIEDEDEDEDGLWVSDVPQYAPEVRWHPGRRVRLPWRTRLRVAPGMLLAVLRGRSFSFGWLADVDTEAEAGDGASDGSWLAGAGLDPGRVRAIRAEGRLLVWLQLLGKDLADGPAGQCAVVTCPGQGVACTEVLELSEGAPHDARQRLVDAAVHAAADLGVRTLLVPGGQGGHEAVDTALC
ncbi:hypothetical protein [Janibacter hoylei]|uniref:hypothetical protein n=1 Tax=Janibacter hoylei TaxID=364298 RepID=UPI0021A7DC06|nr:hypothetical protein [Janibacter hoylei]MCT1617713.1 hypothetical protein [Janibacter hoylei]MCT2292381.1 hypothetical protein [Janibacter hoylei]